MNSPADDAEILEYMATLTPIEREALQVAQKCLPNTFRIRETTGFKDFKPTKPA